ncbi:uncharacterized protein [Coffea arabica]|uniref:Reverse transcriptase domain-containing protein n=1 Tax=Coffea arabica TaxID=13443 RepID=A0ABM4W5A8_COFAR
MSEFYRKMLCVRAKLRTWNKEVFGHIGNKVAELEQAGDANTTFFHAVVWQRRAFNFISRIRSSMGQWLTTVEDIKYSAAAFFETLFSSDRGINRRSVLPFTLPQLSLVDNERLMSMPTTDEVREVVFSISPDSAPGPDGFGFGFYQACWDIIKEDLVVVVQDYFKGGWLPKGVTSTLIMLGPKIEGASHWQDFRAISLCNVSSKIISKLVTNRLNKLLPQLVSPWQSGFVPGRQIIDNILLAHEHAQELDRRLEAPKLMLKLDMEKAYDRVEWSFLIFMLRAFGFQQNAVDLIFHLVANNWFSVLVNGEPVGFFKSTPGGRHRFFQAGGGRVPYLAFADDVIIFTRLSRETLEAVGGFFRQYQQYSGQRINAAKSCFVCPSGATEVQVKLVSSILGFQRQFFPLIYLDVPILRGRCSSIAFDGIIAKGQGTGFPLEYDAAVHGGKLIHLKHVLNSMPLYLLQVLKPPKALWTLKEFIGRLGRSCVSLQRWGDWEFTRWMTWSKPSHAVVARPKGTWKRLLGILELAESQITWSLGPGMVDFWLDTWCELGSLGTLVPPDMDRPHFLVAELFGREGWNGHRLKQWLPCHLVDLILETPFDLDGQDQIIWAGSATKCFSLSSAWELCRQSRGGFPMHGLVWNRGVPLKISIFAWRLLNNFVPLDSMLRRRGLPLVSRCSCCFAEEESVLHLFVRGQVAREVWGHFATMFGMLHLPFDDLQLLWRKWATSLPRIPAHHIRCVLPLLVAWFIWQGRNKARFEGQVFSTWRVTREVIAFLYDVGRANKLEKAQFYGDLDCEWARLTSGVARNRRVIVVTWTKPPALHYKLNTDASVANGRASGGGVLRDSNGRLVFAFYKEFGEK